jgi:hypothetical protein
VKCVQNGRRRISFFPQPAQFVSLLHKLNAISARLMLRARISSTPNKFVSNTSKGVEAIQDTPRVRKRDQLEMGIGMKCDTDYTGAQ